MNISKVFSAAVLMSLYVTSCMSVSSSQDGTLHYCDVIETWSNYNKKELVTVDGTIHHIAISEHTGNIYVAYGWDMMLVLKKNESNTKKQMDSSINSVAVDHYSPRVYIGTAKGLQIYDEVTGVITNVTEVQYKVRRLFVAKNNGDVYVTNAIDDMVYRYRNMFTEKSNLNIGLNNLWITQFVVDLAGNYYYTTREIERDVTNLLLNDQNITLRYNDGPFECLAVDNMGRVFSTIDRDVYYMKVDGTTLKVATLDVTPWQMFFDEKNNVVFGTKENQVVIL